MTIVNVPLERIQDNPYQPRQEYSGIDELAEKILAMRPDLPASRGLIHVPNGRIVNAKGILLAWLGGFSSYPDDYRVQLAEGHRRLRAFKFLAESNPEYASMPVNITDMDDRAMDDVAWDENTARQDLSPIERARSLQRTMEAFGLSQADLAKQRRMSPSAVSNALRLLKLPDGLLAAIHAGKLSERHGIRYLPALDIPEADLRLAGLTTRLQFGITYETPRPDVLARRMTEIGDVTADQVEEIVGRIKKRVEEAKKRAWDEQQRAARPAPTMTPVASAPGPIPGMVPVEVGSPRPIPGLPPQPAEDADSGADPDNEIEADARQEMADEAPQAVPGTSPAGPAPQSLSMPPKPAFLPDVVIAITLKRPADGPVTYLMSAGEAGQWPQMSKGALADLRAVLDAAIAPFVPGEQPAGEQILMEMDVEQDTLKHHGVEYQ